LEKSFKSFENNGLPALVTLNDFWVPSRARDYSFRIRDGGTGTKQRRRKLNSCASMNRTAGLHVVQRAATPAREPAPIGVDIVPRAIVPAGVKAMPAATACFIFIVTFLGPTAALFIRLFA
jgi:hypothetical protein